MPFLRLQPEPLPPSSLMQRAPMLRFLLIAIIGIMGAWWGRNFITSGMWWGLTVGSAALSLLLYYIKQKEVKSKGWKLLPFLMALTLALLSATWLQQRYESICVKWPAYNKTWVAQVDEITKWQTDKVTLTVLLNDSSKVYNHKKLCLQLYDTTATTLHCGDRIAFTSHITEGNSGTNPGDFNYHNYLIQHGFSGSAWCTSSQWIKLSTPQTFNLKNALLNQRQAFVDTYKQYFKSTDLSVLAALTLGDKSLITPSTRQLFSDTGTSHILALSGLHLGIIISLFNLLLLRHLRKKRSRLIASALLLSLLWTFAFMTGLSISLLRAVFMFTLLQIGVCLQRTSNSSLNSLAIAALLLLIIDPLTLFDVGFQLSFSAVFFILITNDYVFSRYQLPLWKDHKELSQVIPKRNAALTRSQHIKYQVIPRIKQATQRKLYRFFRQVIVPFIAISLSAQWGTAPLVIYYFHTFAPYAWLANFVVIPAAYVILSASWLFLLIPLPFLRGIFSVIITQVLQFVTNSLNYITHWPCATLHLYPTVCSLLLILLLPIFLFAFYESRKRKVRQRIIIAFFLAIAIGISCETFHAYNQRITPRIIVYKVPRTTVVHFITSTEKSYLYSSTSPDSTHLRFAYIEQNFFKPYQIKWPQIIQQQRVQWPDFGRTGNLFLFGHKQIVLLNSYYWQPLPHNIDLLIVAKGSTTKQIGLLHKMNIKQIVLDGTLSPYYSKIWTEACLAAHIPCHDVRQQGAFEMDL